ncbi:hypothetical protein J437_LFUL016473 [Ladona fulva]|uniref:Transferrin-like domain-containing protein n=1 Tax=Ladona fulva TaxID=123851 RepID=A0A8K0P6Q1_LADFU|nr:hypothetical protein J437_LFUL016473 [Ladona fulva]
MSRPSIATFPFASGFFISRRLCSDWSVSAVKKTGKEEFSGRRGRWRSVSHVHDRFCVVTSSNSSGTAPKYCPFLDAEDSPAVCVLECLRRLTVGKADFAVLQAEEIFVASKTSSPQVLITNELRLWKEYKYEYQMVVIVRNTLNITGISDLRGKRFCHPGFDLQHDWTDVTSNCEPNMTIMENRLKSSSEFFGSACKPGSWVGDPSFDEILKSKYPNLCQLCDVPRQCSNLDKYWGPKGVLLCLSDEAGDVAWARLDDTLFHFGINPDGPALAVPAEFSVLCPNGNLEPLAPLTARSPPPCSWMSRPWGVVAARSKIALEVQKLVSMLDNAVYRTWQWALQYLLTRHTHSIVEIETMLTPEDYLSKADGFLSASAQFSCGMSRSVKMCTPTLLEEAKCSWMREASLAYGLSPAVSCLGPEGEDGKNDDVNHCLESVAKGSADVAVLDTKDQLLAERSGFLNKNYDLYNLIN